MVPDGLIQKLGTIVPYVDVGVDFLKGFEIELILFTAGQEQ
jgi:hypothetical protein